MRFVCEKCGKVIDDEIISGEQDIAFYCPRCGHKNSPQSEASSGAEIEDPSQRDTNRVQTPQAPNMRNRAENQEGRSENGVFPLFHNPNALAVKKRWSYSCLSVLIVAFLLFLLGNVVSSISYIVMLFGVLLIVGSFVVVRRLLYKIDETARSN